MGKKNDIPTYWEAPDLILSFHQEAKSINGFLFERLL